jgi:hypothetical protein
LVGRFLSHHLVQDVKSLTVKEIARALHNEMQKMSDGENVRSFWGLLNHLYDVHTHLSGLVRFLVGLMSAPNIDIEAGFNNISKYES